MILRFATKEECEAFIQKHQVNAWPHLASDGCWIAVFSIPEGVFALKEDLSGELLGDW